MSNTHQQGSHHHHYQIQGLFKDFQELCAQPKMIVIINKPTRLHAYMHTIRPESFSKNSVINQTGQHKFSNNN